MSLEAEFLDAVSKNQVDEVKQILDNGMPINLQCRDSDGRTALMIAVQEGYLDVIIVLLKHEVYIGDALLLAVEVQFVGAVKALCRYSETEKVKEIGKDFINSFPVSVFFPPSSTPLQMAARLKDYAIVKVLLDHDARMPSLKAVLIRAKDDSFEKALAQLHWYQAITSEAYLLLASEDPMDAAFYLAEKLRVMSSNVTQLKEEYDELHNNLEQFLTRLLGFARNLDEIEAVLGAQRFVSDVTLIATCDALPVRLQEAVKLDFKRFVAHSTCQDYMLSRWYSGTDKTWRTLSSVKMAAMSALVALAWPLLCLFYIIVPSGKMVDFIRTPYVRFLIHTGSRLTFLCLLLSTSVTYLHQFAIRNTFRDSPAIMSRVHDELRTDNVVLWLIFMWILGMTWREMKEIWRCGVLIYLKNHWNWLDSLQLVFYWVYVTLSIVSYLKVDRLFAVLEPEPREGAPRRLTMPCSILRARVHEDRLPESCFVTPGNDTLFDGTPRSPQVMIIWSPYDPIFVAEAAFAIANVLTQLSLLNAMVALSMVGPLQISLGGMVRDIGKFMLIFGIVLVAFSLGMTQMFRTFELVRQQLCDENCEVHPFGSFTNTMSTLFWSLFDLMDLDNLKLDDDLQFTEFVGCLMYACYSVVGVVVLLNALIAMMSNTYTRVEENSDVEWKVARTRLMTEYLSESATIPPPLNIIPSTRSILKLYKNLTTVVRRKPTQHRRRDAGRNFQQDGYKHIVKKLVQRFLWQEKMLRSRVRHMDRVQTELIHLKDALEMARPGSSTKRLLRNTFSNASRKDPYLRQFYKQFSGGDLRDVPTMQQLNRSVKATQEVLV